MRHVKQMGQNGGNGAALVCVFDLAVQQENAVGEAELKKCHPTGAEEEAGSSVGRNSHGAQPLMKLLSPKSRTVGTPLSHWRSFSRPALRNMMYVDGLRAHLSFKEDTV